MKDENVLLGCTRVERIHKSTLSSFRYTSPRETRHYTGLSITINRSNCSQVYSHPGFTWQPPGTLRLWISPSISRCGLPAHSPISTRGLHRLDPRVKSGLFCPDWPATKGNASLMDRTRFIAGGGNGHVWSRQGMDSPSRNVD